jgi:phosphate transport system permease protein
MSLCILSTLTGFAQREKINGKKDTPIVTEKVAKFGLRLSGILCVATLFGLMAYVAIRGAQFISWDFITGSALDYTSIGRRIVGLEAGSIGGIRDFILGGLLCVGYCELIAIPLGLGAAIFLSEYAPDNRFITTLRFFIETLAGAPSIILGLFGFTFFVQMAGMSFSLPAAGLSLAFMILPWNIRVAEEAMRAVPKAYREASYALGATKWQTIKRTVLLPSSPGAITGILLGVGAAFGETAVLIFTAGGLGTTTLPNPISLTGGPGQQMPVLAVWILGAYRNIHANGPNITASMVWQESNVAYSASLVLLLIFLAISIGALILRNYLAKKTKGA